MSDTDRPTPIGEGDRDTEVDLPLPDLDESSDRNAMLPGAVYWPDEETT